MGEGGVIEDEELSSHKKTECNERPLRLPNIAICADYIFNTDLRRDHRPRWGDNRQ